MRVLFVEILTFVSALPDGIGLNCSTYGDVVNLSNLTSQVFNFLYKVQLSCWRLSSREASLKRNQYISENQCISPYDVSGLPGANSECEENAQDGCYTLLISDNDGDLIVQNGCHDGSLNYQPGCMCTPGNGYSCWTLCTTSNCNDQIDLNEDLFESCQNSGSFNLANHALFVSFFFALSC